MDAGIIGGIAGSVIGIGGGVIGTWFSIKNTRGPLERDFMIRASIVAWIGIGLFIALLLLLPSSYRFYAWIPYGIALPLGIMKMNRRLAQLQQLDATG